jgi:hypothetical protein
LSPLCKGRRVDAWDEEVQHFILHSEERDERERDDNETLGLLMLYTPVPSRK